MHSEIGDAWGRLLVLGWLLSPIVFIAAAMIMVILAELGRRARSTGSNDVRPRFVHTKATPTEPA